MVVVQTPSLTAKGNEEEEAEEEEEEQQQVKPELLSAVTGYGDRVCGIIQGVFFMYQSFECLTFNYNKKVL